MGVKRKVWSLLSPAELAFHFINHNGKGGRANIQA
jgi:hypothetical protein